MAKRSRQTGIAVVRERATFSYDPLTTSPDLKEQIVKLGEIEDSSYFGRSLADIAGMILKKAVPKEIERYEEKNEK